MKIKIGEIKEVELTPHEEAIYNKGKLCGQVEMFMAWLSFIVIVLLISQCGR